VPAYRDNVIIAPSPAPAMLYDMDISMPAASQALGYIYVKPNAALYFDNAMGPQSTPLTLQAETIIIEG
jgi:hypothetical protein